MKAYIKMHSVDVLNFFGYIKTDLSPEQPLQLLENEPQPKSEFKGFYNLNNEIIQEISLDHDAAKKKWIKLDGSDDLRKKYNFMPEQYIEDHMKFTIL